MTQYNSITLDPNTYRYANYKTTLNSIDLANVPWKYNSMSNAFNGCSNIKSITNINDSIVNIDYTFYRCSKLIETPDISNCQNLTSMNNTFTNCSKLTDVSSIPNNITHMNSTFSNFSN